MKGGLKGFSLFLKRWLPVLLWAALVLWASTGAGSGNNTARFLKSLLTWIHPDFMLTSIREINFFIRKTAHVVQFVVYAQLLWRALEMAPALVTQTRQRLLWILGSSAVLAILSEVIQIFSPHRTGLFGDVLLDMSGAVGGSVLLLALRLRFPHEKKQPPPSPPGHLSKKILITSDLHLDRTPDEGRSILRKVREQFFETRADVLLVAGDFGVANRAQEWMAGLRQTLGPDACIVICLGNHDHWLEPPCSECTSPENVRETFWRPACRAHNIHCLDFGNVDMPDITLCGGYAHYDFSFRNPTVAAEGRSPTLADYQAGRFGELVCPDPDRIPGLHALDEAAEQTRKIANRLSQAKARAKPILFASHTLPFAELLRTEMPPVPLQRFFDAYSGNSTIGNVLSTAKESVLLAVSGHTHHPSPLLQIHGIPCITTGSSPSHPRFLLFDANTSMIFRTDHPQHPTPLYATVV